MKRNIGWVLLASVTAILFTMAWDFTPRVSSQGKQKRGPDKGIARDKPTLENYDIRSDHSKENRVALESYRRQILGAKQKSLLSARQAMMNAQAKLAERVPGLKVEVNQALVSPEIVGVEGGDRLLTKPSREGHETIARRFIAQNAALYGLTAAQAAQLKVIAGYTNPAGNLSWIELQQEINGIPVFQGTLRAVLSKEGEIVRTAGNLAPSLSYVSMETAPKMSAVEAAAAAAESIGVAVDSGSLSIETAAPDGKTHVLSGGPFAESVKAELVYFPLEPGVATLAYSMVLWGDVAAYYILVDANTGRLLWRKNITNNQSQSATYSVYNDDSPAPLSPTNVLPGSGIQGVGLSRTTISLVSELPAFDNLGWIPDGSNVTTGNNVDAGLDVFFPNGIDPDSRPTGSPFRVFNFTYNPGGTPGEQAPTGADYRKGAVTNVFFWANRYHDRLYELGFTEAAGNFRATTLVVEVWAMIM